MLPPHKTSVSALPRVKGQAKYDTFLFNAVSLFDSNNTHLAHFVQISSTLDDSLSSFLFVQLLTLHIQNVGHLCEHTGREMHSPFIGISQC